MADTDIGVDKDSAIYSTRTLVGLNKQIEELYTKMANEVIPVPDSAPDEFKIMWQDPNNMNAGISDAALQNPTELTQRAAKAFIAQYYSASAGPIQQIGTLCSALSGLARKL